QAAERAARLRLAVDAGTKLRFKRPIDWFDQPVVDFKGRHFRKPGVHFASLRAAVERVDFISCGRYPGSRTMPSIDFRKTLRGRSVASLISDNPPTVAGAAAALPAQASAPHSRFTSSEAPKDGNTRA